MISTAEAKRIDANISAANKTDQHPLIGISSSMPSHIKTEKILSLETLCEWFAKKADVPYYIIDPLNIDIGSVSNIVAPQYAKNHGILAVENTNDFVTLAVKNLSLIHI